MKKLLIEYLKVILERWKDKRRNRRIGELKKRILNFQHQMEVAELEKSFHQEMLEKIINANKEPEPEYIKEEDLLNMNPKLVNDIMTEMQDVK